MTYPNNLKNALAQKAHQMGIREFFPTDEKIEEIGLTPRMFHKLLDCKIPITTEVARAIAIWARLSPLEIVNVTEEAIKQ